MTFENNLGILRNPEVFEEDFIPGILFRDSEIAKLTLCLKPFLKGKKPINVWLQGPSGSGKTCLAKFFFANLQKNPRIRTAYVNCFEADSLCKVLDSLTGLRDFNSFTTKISDKILRLKGLCKEKRFIVLLDEIDRVSRFEMNSIIYNLAGIKNISLVCLTTEKDFFVNLDERASSRFCPVLINLDSYNPEEMAEILKERVRFGTLSSECDEAILKKIAGQSAGNARTAIQTLRNAILMAENQGHKEIPLEVIEKSCINTKDLKRAKLLRDLSEHQLLLYRVIERNPGILSSDLYKTYLRHCRTKKTEPVASRTYSKYCEKLEQVGFIQRERVFMRGNTYRYTVIL